MANQKELDLLSTGKTLWNTWRREYAEIHALELDLHEADLHSADLQGFDLLNADLTERVFLVRERISPDGGPGPDDRIVRSFDVRHDAYMYADSMNEKQKRLDGQTAIGRGTLG